jgi:GIY-YIG catalytic domain
MPDYQKSQIYKIVSNKTTDIYIGSTVQKLCNRMAAHKSAYKKYILSNKSKYNYCTSFEVIKYGDAEIILIETCPCNSKEELYRREKFWIDHFIGTSINRYSPINDDINNRNRNRTQWTCTKEGKEPVLCIWCGDLVKKVSLQTRHVMTKKHIDNVEFAMNL